MPELKEVFEMVSQKVEPDLDAWNQQEQRQRRTARNRRIGAFAVAAALLTVAAIVATTLPAQDRTNGVGTSPAHLGGVPAGLTIVGVDGGVRSELSLPRDAWMADLSPDGEQVMFVTGSIEVGFCGQCIEGQDRLAIVPVGRATGTFVYLETRRGIGVEHPVWSPDGSRVAFVGLDAAGERDVYVADLSGQTFDGIVSVPVRRLTNDPWTEQFPAWSSDASTIYYDSSGSEPLDDSGFSSTQEIWSVPADGGSPTRLTRNDVPDAQPDASAGGTVVYWRDGDIWTMDRSGNDQRRLTAVPSGLGFDPRWSPDGSAIALLRYDASERALLPPDLGRPTNLPLLEVVVVDLATGDITALGSRVASDVNPPSWTPDGASLLVNRYD